ncbi:MAG TPA: hypothetical protein VMH41_13670 [Mycobacteriales bacterium]|nr:hypothetical protein [Mycobacteriales bacterium]
MNDVGGGGWGEVGFFDGFDEFGVSGLECAGFVSEVADTGAEHICIRSRPGAALLNVARPSLGSPETRPRAS